MLPVAGGKKANIRPETTLAGTFICDKACYDRMCAHDAANFYAWAKEDKRVAVLAPWNWGGCAACNGSRWTPPHT